MIILHGKRTILSLEGFCFVMMHRRQFGQSSICLQDCLYFVRPIYVVTVLLQ